MGESIFGIHEAAFRVRNARSELLANNLANADTPNFKAQDIDFRKALQQASDEFEIKNDDLKVTNSRHISGDAMPSTSKFLMYRQPTQPALDGNTVESHIEKAKFTENSLQQQITLEFINGRITSIKGALRGE